MFNRAPKQTHAKSTQHYLDVAEIRDGIVLLKDGNLRSILAVSSVNFALKSETEQEALVASYQNFLNTLDFPVQILMQNRRMDVGPYIDLLKNRLLGVTNNLLQIQMAEYIEFINQLVETAHIMSKSFYVVVPFNIAPSKQGLWTKFARVLNPAKSVIIDTKAFEEYKVELHQRVAAVSGGLGSMGLEAITLTTEEVIELLYSSYNIGSATIIQAEALQKLDFGNGTTIQ